MTQNVVLLCLDTVRHDYFERYGGQLRDQSNHSFDECRTTSTWSVSSHASIFTESLPHEHGFHSATPSFDQLDPEDTFLEDLEGYRTVGISANPYASPIFGFDELFDDFFHITSSMPYPEGLSPSKFWHESDSEGVTRYVEFLRSCLTHDHPAKSVANGVVSQAEKLFQRLPLAKPFDDGCNEILKRAERELNRSDEPTFLFVNIMDAHGPLTNVRGYDQSLLSDQSRKSTPDLDALGMNMDETLDEHSQEIGVYRELYAAAVEYVSRQVADFCESVNDDTAVIITADHGEQLAEDEHEPRFGHVTPDMTEPLLHVPLEVINTTLEIDETKPISHLDLGRLVTAIATDHSFEREVPLAAEVAGIGVAHPPTDHERFEYWDRSSRCVYLDGVKYVWDSLGKAHRFEQTDGGYSSKAEITADEVPEAATDIFSVDVTDLKAESATTELSDDIESQLEELGYL
ncbi:sulfatase-like hydrolase/transferase [Halobacterium salinarum]|uniref:AlkP-core domain protein n=1 Tax=Halobacterium salinarum (strain ATCC 33171 / DSM 3754 / JCM 8978 / NBRC 102687 / NCIMB 764 / 91-R6) TaxID=2597657 RepID=A0A4D6GUW2_HALS9|nr:sulfatase-like hydrolase/transferase [Halobacterium salinarum]QCC44906.1 AlkP-core domain protein [Halobacterium salinarum]TYO73669.1 Arylsulfatase A [Halobacterium salinarum DSM 3754]